MNGSHVTALIDSWPIPYILKEHWISSTDCGPFMIAMTVIYSSYVLKHPHSMIYHRCTLINISVPYLFTIQYTTVFRITWRYHFQWWYIIEYCYRYVSCGWRHSRFLKRLVFLIGNVCVYFAVRTKFLNINCMKFTFQTVNPQHLAALNICRTPCVVDHLRICAKTKIPSQQHRGQIYRSLCLIKVLE